MHSARSEGARSEGARLLGCVVVVVALLLHLAAHIAPSAPHVREALPEDRPALLANRSLSPDTGAPLADALAGNAPWGAVTPGRSRAGSRCCST